MNAPIAPPAAVPALHPLLAAPGGAKPAPPSSTPTTFDAWADQPGAAMLVFAEEPERYKETLDLAVIVPELHAARAGAVPRRAAAARGVARAGAALRLRALAGVRDAARRPVPRRGRRHPRLGRLHRRTRPPAGRRPDAAADGRHPGQAPIGRVRSAVLPLTTEERPMRPVNIPIRSLMPEPDDARRVHADAARDEHLRDAAPARARAGQRRRRRARRAGTPSCRTSRPGWPSGDALRSRQLPALDLAGLAPDALRVLNETLGEGEVAAIVDAGHEIRVQETVFSRHLARAALRRQRRAAARLPAGRADPAGGRRAGARDAPRRPCARCRLPAGRDERAGAGARAAGGDGPQRRRARRRR